MNVQKARALLDKAASYHHQSQEKSIFDLGGRGYYENPTSDLLAFFLDPEQDHGLGDCFLRALLDCLPEGDRLSAALCQVPQREVSTNSGKRMDLVLDGDGWMLILENKIFHHQNNPFVDYEKYLLGLCNKNRKHPLFVLISPSGEASPSHWTGLKYEHFIGAVRKRLDRYEAQPLNKWQMLAKEFLLHLCNTAAEYRMNNDVFDFVFDNLCELDKLQKLREQAIDALDARIIDRVKAEISGFNLTKTRRHNWPGGLALRYGCSDWGSGSDVVLFLDVRKEYLQPSVRVYLFDMDEFLKQQACQAFTAYEKKGEEKGGSVLRFEYILDEFKEQGMLEVIVGKMKMLIAFERFRFQNQDRRPLR